MNDVENDSETTVIVPPEYEILREADKSYYVRKPDGEKVFVCKLCGAELSSVAELAGHFQKEHRDTNKVRKPKQKKEPSREIIDENNGTDEFDDDTEIEPESVTKEATRGPRRHREVTTDRISTPMTPEEEMLEEMSKVLKEQMEATPGIGSGQKTNWFVDYFFKRVTALQEDKERLVAALRRHFPKTDEDAIRLIADSVFEVRDRYERALRQSQLLTKSSKNYWNMYDTQYNNYTAGSRYGRFDRMDFMNPGPGSMDIGMMNLIYQMTREIIDMKEQQFRMMLDMMKQQNQTYDPQTMQKIIEAEVENRLLRHELEQMREQMNKMFEYLQNERRFSPVSSDGWRDDYARLVAELGTRGLQLAEQIILENKRTRQLIVKYVLPRFMDRRAGEDNVKIEPTGSGKSDEEIIDELEEAGLVE